MTSRFKIILVTFSVLLPILVFAQTLTPADIFMSLKNGSSSVDVDFALFGSIDDTYAAAWLKGNMYGKTLANAGGDLRLTVDVKEPDNEVVRVRVQLRYTDKVVYLMLEDIIGPIKDDMESITDMAILKQWYSYPLTESVLNEFTNELEDEEVLPIVLDLVNELFTDEVVETNARSTVHSLKLNKGNWRNILAKAQEISNSQGIVEPIEQSDIREFRSLLNALNIHVKVTSKSNGSPEQVKGYVSFAKDEYKFAIDGTVAYNLLPKRVTAPTDAISLDSNRNNIEEYTDDAQRRIDVNTILNAVYQYAIDNNGELPKSITTTPTEICRTGAQNCRGKVVLDDLLEYYLVSIPVDPSLPQNDSTTGYVIYRYSDYRIMVRAMYNDGDQEITVTR